MKTGSISQILALLVFLQGHSLADRRSSTLPITISYSDKQIHFTNHLASPSSKLTLSLIDHQFDGQENVSLRKDQDSPENGHILHATLPDSTIRISRSRARQGEPFLEEFVFVWSPVLDRSSIKLENSHRSANKKQVCLDYVPETTGAFVYPTALSDDVLVYPMGNHSANNIDAPFVSGISPVGSILDRLFFLSTGAALLLDDLHPWAVSGNVNQSGALCFYLDYGRAPYNIQSPTHPRAYFSIQFRLLLGRSLKAVWQAAVGDLGYIRRPRQAPAVALFHRPIWPLSPFNDFDTFRYQKPLEDMLTCLEERCPPNQTAAVLFVDESFSWQRETNPWQGDSDQGTSKGPHHRPPLTTMGLEPRLLEKLNRAKEKGTLQLAIWMGPTVWGSPAASEESWLMNRNQLDSQTEQCTLDFTNLKAQHFFLSHLGAFRRQSPFTRLFFSGGNLETFLYQNETSGYLFKTPTCPVVGKYPSFMISLYGQTVGQLQPYSGALNAAFKMQPLPVFTRLTINYVSYRESSIKRLLSRALVLAMAGYQFIQPELTGIDEAPEAPGDVVLYQRWLQAVTFFPLMSLLELGHTEAPLEAARVGGRLEEARAIFANCTAASLALRQAIFSPLIGSLLADWTDSGEPLFRPMWYAAADDEKPDSPLYQIDDQFMLGGSLLVAPVVQLNETQRDVYLPSVTWVNGLTGRSHTGPGPLKQIAVSTEQLLYFTRKNVGK